MKFSCVQNKISNSVVKNNLIVSRTLDLPILSCVLMTTTDNQVILQTTDIEHALTITIPAQITESGSIAVSSEVLTKLLQGGSKEDVVSFETKNDTVEISNPHSNSTITTQDHTDFPAIPHIETEDNTIHFSINTSNLVSGLQSVAFAASHSNIKPELSSVFVKYEAGRLYCVCTDGFRLAEKVIKTDLGAEDFSFLLPVKSVGVIGKIFESTTEGDVDVFVTDNQIALQNNNIYFTCRLVSGSFPDYKKLIPTEKETSAVMLKDDLVGVLKLSNIFSNEFHEVVLNIDPKKKLCELTSQNKEVGINQTNIPAALEGDAVTVTFNYRFLSEVLPVVGTDSLELAFTDPGRPMKLTTVPETSLNYIVMPLNK